MCWKLTLDYEGRQCLQKGCKLPRDIMETLTQAIADEVLEFAEFATFFNSSKLENLDPCTLEIFKELVWTGSHNTISLERSQGPPPQNYQNLQEPGAEPASELLDLSID